MYIDQCSSCGECQDFVREGKCPTNAFTIEKYRGYAYAKIDEKACIDCKLCLEIDCLGEAITEGRQEL